MTGSLVVKLGGSLFLVAARVLEELRGSGRDILVVPGGGQWADLVREMHLPDSEAHWMAVAAMELSGWSLAVLGAEPTDRLEAPRGLQVLLPYRVLREHDPLPHTWDVTSDTIAAWVAHRLGLPLLVAKAVDGIRADGKLVARLSRPVPCGEVDPSFLPFVFRHRVPVTVISGLVPGRIAAFLAGRGVPGTVIGPML